MQGEKRVRRILVVEDEFLLAAHIGSVLEDEGLEVVGPVGTLSEALKLARDESLDAALLDLNLDGGRVDDVAEILDRRHVPFVFVTGFGRDDLPPGFRESIIVSKPFNDKELLKQVHRLTDEG